MMLKRMLFWLLLFLSLSTVASAQQVTKADIQVLDPNYPISKQRLIKLSTPVHCRKHCPRHRQGLKPASKSR